MRQSNLIGAYALCAFAASAVAAADADSLSLQSIASGGLDHVVLEQDRRPTNADRATQRISDDGLTRRLSRAWQRDARRQRVRVHARRGYGSAAAADASTGPFADSGRILKKDEIPGVRGR